MPIGGGKSANTEEERPLGSSKGGYNLDSLGADAFGDQGGDALIVMENKPKAKPPARFAQKKAEEVKKEEAVIEDERPIKK